MASSDVTAVTKYFAQANEGFTTTLASTIVSGATSVPLNSTSGLTDTSVFVGIIEPGATGQQVFTGTVDVGGSQITGVKWTRGSNTGHAGGVTIVDYTTGTAFNMMSAGMKKQHTDGGAHTGITTDTLSSTGNVTVGGTLTPTGGLSANSVTYTALLSTIFSGQVSSQANAGSAGGTMYYINLGGVKMLWVTSASQTTSAGGNTYTFTWPTSFFTTIQMIAPTMNSQATNTGQNCAINAITGTTSADIKVTSPNGNATAQFSVFVIGT